MAVLDDEKLRESILDKRTPVGMFFVTLQMLDAGLASHGRLSAALFGDASSESTLALRTDRSEKEIRQSVFESVRACSHAREAFENAIGSVMQQIGPERFADLILEGDSEAIDEATRVAVSELTSAGSE